MPPSLPLSLPQRATPTPSRTHCARARKNAISTSFTLMCTFLGPPKLNPPRKRKDSLLFFSNVVLVNTVKFAFKLKVNANENYF